MKYAIALIAASALVACAEPGNRGEITAAPEVKPLTLAAAAPREVDPAAEPAARRDCPPLPELRAGASGTERRIHTQTIVRMYAACAGSAP